MTQQLPLSAAPGPIGVFDSGYGGLTILKEIVKELPQYDYLYLGDNARAPYGTRSFETVYQYTLECVNELFAKGCHLVILACNTASAKALRNIQQKDLPNIDASRRVLGVIRPTTEIVGNLSKTKHVGVLGTTGTVVSNSYPIEIEKFFPELKVYQEACPMWVPLIENNQHQSPGGQFFIQQDLLQLLEKDPKIDTILLGCTHYPIVKTQIETALPDHIRVIAQGNIVAASLADYLIRHPEMDDRCSKGGNVRYWTTENAQAFSEKASALMQMPIQAEHIHL